MAKSTLQSGPALKNSIYIIISLFVLLALVLGAYYIFKDTQIENTPDQIEITDTPQNQDDELDNAGELSIGSQTEQIKKEENISNIETSNDDELNQRLIIYNAFVEEISPVLSLNGKSEIEKVKYFISSNNEALMQETSTYPQDIQSAIQSIKEEAKQKLGSLAIYQEITLSEEELKKSENKLPILKAQGDSFSGTGNLEMVQTAEENLFGTLFRIVDSKHKIPFYMMFGENKTNNLAEMVGTEVNYTVKVVKYDGINKIAILDIISGPSKLELPDEEIENNSNDD